MILQERETDGRGRKNPAAVQTAVLLAVLIGLFGLLLRQGMAAPLLRLLGTPEGIFDAAALYLRVYLLGYPFLLLFDFGAATDGIRFSRCFFRGLRMWG